MSKSFASIFTSAGPPPGYDGPVGVAQPHVPIAFPLEQLCALKEEKAGLKEENAGLKRHLGSVTTQNHALREKLGQQQRALAVLQKKCGQLQFALKVVQGELDSQYASSRSGTSTRAPTPSIVVSQNVVNVANV